jgi:hypothetical protein
MKTQRFPEVDASDLGARDGAATWGRVFGVREHQLVLDLLGLEA